MLGLKTSKHTKGVSRVVHDTFGVTGGGNSKVLSTKAQKSYRACSKQDPGYPNFLIKNANGNHCGPLVNLFFFKIYYQWVPMVTNGRITNHY